MKRWESMQDVEAWALEVNQNILDLALENRDLKVELQATRNELAHYKNMCRQKQHCDSLEVIDLAEDMVLERELHRVK